MKKYTLSILAVILFICCSFAPADWLTYKSEDGKFSIMFPAKPQESNEPVETAAGKVDTHILMLESTAEGDNALYGMIYVDYPAALLSSDMPKDKLDVMFNGAIEGGAANIKGTVVSKEDIKYKGYPGVKGKISFEGGIMIMEAIMVKSRIYMMEVGYETGKNNVTLMNKYLESFQITSVK